MKSRKGRIFKRVIYFLLSFIALQSIALIIYETLMIMGVVEGSFRQGEAFTFIFAAIICLAVGVVYQLCYKEETSPVTRKIVIGWGALSYPFLQLPVCFRKYALI